MKMLAKIPAIKSSKTIPNPFFKFLSKSMTHRHPPPTSLPLDKYYSQIAGKSHCRKYTSVKKRVKTATSLEKKKTITKKTDLKTQNNYY